jgi:hypothetical protein
MIYLIILIMCHKNIFSIYLIKVIFNFEVRIIFLWNGTSTYDGKHGMIMKRILLVKLKKIHKKQTIKTVKVV